jgi:DNA-binding CsgD family transcriptional regulator
MTQIKSTIKALTKRQAQVLNLYKSGKKVPAIAKVLGVKRVTVYATLRAAHNRLGNTDRLNKAYTAEQAARSEVINNTIVFQGEVYLRREFVRACFLKQLGIIKGVLS